MQKERTSLAKKVGFKKKRCGAGKISLDQHVFCWFDSWIIPSWQIKIAATLVGKLLGWSTALYPIC